jgi:hypothetical protein
LEGQEQERKLILVVDIYNNERVHESVENVTPADVYHCRHREILTARQLQKCKRCGEGGGIIWDMS